MAPGLGLVDEHDTNMFVISLFRQPRKLAWLPQTFMKKKFAVIVISSN